MEYRGRIDADRILNSQWCERIVSDETEEVAARARALAPVRTGHLRGSITARTMKNSGAKRDRVVGIVSTNAHAKDGSGYGSPEEFGTSESRGNYFLRRALNG